MRFCIIIPTHNRLQAVQKYLEEAMRFCTNSSCDIIVFDTSQNNDIERLVAKFRHEGMENLFYDRYFGETEKCAIDKKVFAAAAKYAPKYDYLLFSSDGTIIRADILINNVDKYLHDKFDLIVFDNSKTMEFFEKQYTDWRILFEECCWLMTRLGSIIVSSRLLQEAVKNYPFKLENTVGFWLPMSYFCCIDCCKCRAVYKVIEGSWEQNPNIVESFWKVSGNLLWQWGKIWSEAIEALPKQYESKKNIVILSHDKYTRLFSFKSLVGMQAWNNITLDKVITYRRYISKVATLDIIFFYVIALICRRPIIVFLKKVYNAMRTNFIVNLGRNSK